MKEQDHKVQKRNFSVLAVAVISAAALIAACGGTASTTGGVDPNETAATVNGKAIKMEDVERAVKQQARGEEAKLSPLELAGARLQVLQSLIEQEVMYQKAEKENTVPSDDEVTAEVNKQKVESRLSAEEFQKQMDQVGLDDKTFRENVKKGLAIKKLIDKITGKIEPPKDNEIEAFYNGNKDAFVKKRGVKLAAIVVDPTSSGEGDTTVDEQSAVIKANEIIKKLQSGQDFAQVARENSEDQSRFQSGDLGYVSEEDMRQTFPEQLTASLMNPQTEIGKIFTARMQGKLYILKLQDRSDRDEQVTLNSPGVREQVTDSLVNSRKQLLAASYQAIAMNESKIENYLAKKVVENPNELSGARPAVANTPVANTSSAVTNSANTSTANTASNAGSNTGVKPGSNAAANRPAPAKPTNTAPANTNPSGNR
jgi:parvulin-like peptidyl-prolyl isomerase